MKAAMKTAEGVERGYFILYRYVRLGLVGLTVRYVDFFQS
jgi:hypothetical protein